MGEKGRQKDVAIITYFTPFYVASIFHVLLACFKFSSLFRRGALYQFTIF